MTEKELYVFCKEYLTNNNGVFIWTKKPHYKAKLNNILNRKRKDGYEDIKLKGKRYLVHRIVWLMEYGKFPIHTIDHIDGVRSNNAITNLRDVTQSVNNTDTGKGYYWCKREKKYIVYKTYSKGDTRYIGRYTTELQAKSKVNELRGTIGVACEG